MAFKPEATLSVLTVLTEGLKRGKVTIAFARGGMDILLPIDTSVIDTKPDGERIHSPKAAEEFYECNSQLLDNLKAELTETTAPGKR